MSAPPHTRPFSKAPNLKGPACVGLSFKQPWGSVCYVVTEGLGAQVPRKSPLPFTQTTLGSMRVREKKPNQYRCKNETGWGRTQGGR